MIGSIAAFVAWAIGIVVLIRLFQKGGVIQGIIGLATCQIWTFIWGWRNAKAENLTTMMWIWTGIIVISAIVNGVTGGPTMPTGGDVVPPVEATEEGARIILRILGA